MSVNKNIRIKRKEKAITTYALSDMIGVSQSAIVRYENGTISFVPVNILEKMAKAFGCTVDELTEGDLRYAQSKKRSKKSFSVEEQNLICKYRKLPEQMQNIIKEICDLHISIE